MGLSGSLEHLPDDTKDAAFLRERFQALAKTAAKYQRKDGSFAWLLPAQEGPADSSATAMIACALLQGIKGGELEVEQAKLEECVLHAGLFLLTCMRDGRVERCSGECEGFAQYPQRYGSYPWSVGPTLKLFGMLEKGV